MACLERDARHGGGRLPTLFRFLGVLAVLGGIGFAAMLALTIMVEPEQREMSVPIDPKKFAR